MTKRVTSVSDNTTRIFQVPSQSQLIKSLQSDNVLPMFVYELNQLREQQKSGGFINEPCPIYRHGLTDNNSFIFPADQIHIRKHIIPAKYYHR